MAGICFFFESSDVDVWSGKKLDAWNYACMAAGDIDKMIVINKTDQKIPHPNRALDFHVVKSVEEAMDLMAGTHITQVVCPWDFDTSIPLWDFNHQTDWYLLGPARGWVGKRVGAKVSIPQNGKGACHSVHIATVLLFHRFGVLN